MCAIVAIKTLILLNTFVLSTQITLFADIHELKAFFVNDCVVCGYDGEHIKQKETPKMAIECPLALHTEGLPPCPM